MYGIIGAGWEFLYGMAMLLTNTAAQAARVLTKVNFVTREQQNDQTQNDSTAADYVQSNVGFSCSGVEA